MRSILNVFLLLSVLLEFGCQSKNAQVRICGKFPVNQNAVVRIVNDQIDTLVNVKDNKFSISLRNVKKGFYSILIKMPYSPGDYEYFTKKNGQRIKIFHARSISREFYLDPKQDTVYRFDLKKPMTNTELESLPGAAFSKLKLNLHTNCYDCKVYEEVGIIRNKYQDINVRQRDSLTKGADYYLSKGDLVQYKNTCDSIFDLWKIYLLPKMRVEYRSLMQKRLNSIITPYLIDQSNDLVQHSGIYTDMLNSLSGTAKGSIYEKSARRRLQSISNLIVGKDFPKPIGETPDGKTFVFNPSKSKYTLVEFWASWCLPCRAKNPWLINIYNKYPRKDFDILSVSIDTNGEEWQKAINADKLPWQQVSDLLPMEESENTGRYNVFAIPHNFLINSKGKIVAKNIGEKALEKLLAK